MTRRYKSTAVGKFDFRLIEWWGLVTLAVDFARGLVRQGAGSSGDWAASILLTGWAGEFGADLSQAVTTTRSSTVTATVAPTSSASAPAFYRGTIRGDGVFSVAGGMSTASGADGRIPPAVTGPGSSNVLDIGSGDVAVWLSEVSLTPISRTPRPGSEKALNPKEVQSYSDVLRHHGVGVAGFEPTTSSSRTKHATKLRHTPREATTAYRTAAAGSQTPSVAVRR